MKTTKATICEACSQNFIDHSAYRTPAKKCPACCDIAAHKPKIIMRRSRLFSEEVVIDETFPLVGWRSAKTPDGIRYKLDAPINAGGNIVVWSKHIPAHGETVRIRKMRSLHRNATNDCVSEREYFVLEPTRYLAQRVLLWLSDMDYPLQIEPLKTETVLDWLDSSTLSKLQADPEYA